MIYSRIRKIGNTIETNKTSEKSFSLLWSFLKNHRNRFQNAFSSMKKASKNQTDATFAF